MPARILGLRGQVVNGVTVEDGRVILVNCRRDIRYRPVDARKGQRGQVNRRLRRGGRGTSPCSVPRTAFKRWRRTWGWPTKPRSAVRKQMLSATDGLPP